MLISNEMKGGFFMSDILGISLGLKNWMLAPRYAEAGFSVVEISLPNKGLDDLKSFTEAAYNLAVKSGMELWSIHLPFSRELDISDPDEKRRRRTVEFEKKVIELARQYAPKVLVIHPSTEPNEDRDRNIRLRYCKESLAELQEAAGDMKLAVENLPRTCIGRSGSEMEQLKGACAGMCFDVNHLLIESHEQFMKPIADCIITTHLSDYDGIDERHWEPGMGIVPFKYVHDTLLAAGYTGPFLFELGSAANGVPYEPWSVVTAWKKLIG